MKIDHIGIKVPSLKQTLEQYRYLGATDVEIISAKEVGLKIALITLGELQIELLEVAATDCPIANFPDGPNHIGFKLKNIESIYKKIKNNPSFEIFLDLREGMHHKKVFFFHMKKNNHFLYEFIAY